MYIQFASWLISYGKIKNIEEEVRFAINNELAELVRRMSGEEKRKDMRDQLERIEDLISSTPSLAKCWSEVSVLAIEPLNR